MGTIEIKITPGTEIDDAFALAIRVAKILGDNITVEFKFNDVTCFGYARGSIDTGCKNYRNALNSNNYKFASA